MATQVLAWRRLRAAQRDVCAAARWLDRSWGACSCGLRADQLVDPLEIKPYRLGQTLLYRRAAHRYSNFDFVPILQ